MELFLTVWPVGGSFSSRPFRLPAWQHRGTFGILRRSVGPPLEAASHNRQLAWWFLSEPWGTKCTGQN